jgi:hypothetical protein
MVKEPRTFCGAMPPEQKIKCLGSFLVSFEN